MVYLLKCLVTIILNPQPLSQFQSCPKPSFQLGPTENIYPAPPSLSRLSHCQNPNKSDSPKWISVPPRWPCQLSVIVCINFGLTELCISVSPRWLAKSLLPYCFTLVPPSWFNRCHWDVDCPKPLHFGPSELCISVPPRFLKFLTFTQFGATESYESVPPSWVESE